MKFHEIQKPETLEKRFIGKLSKKALSFIKCLLKMDPDERISAAKALEHPLFDGLREDNFMTILKENEESVHYLLFICTSNRLKIEWPQLRLRTSSRSIKPRIIRGRTTLNLIPYSRYRR